MIRHKLHALVAVPVALDVDEDVDLDSSVDLDGSEAIRRRLTPPLTLHLDCGVKQPSARGADTS